MKYQLVPFCTKTVICVYRRIISVVLAFDCITNCSLSGLGYGQTGPMVQRAGYDSIAAAVSGLMHITGHEVWCSTYIVNRIFVLYTKAWCCME